MVVQVKELEDALQAKDTKIQALQQQASLAATLCDWHAGGKARGIQRMTLALL
jgi:hypothetical protein